jgi:polar amino acid transport system permease protein
MRLLWDVRWLLLKATWTTAKLFVLAALLALALSLVFGVARVAKWRWLAWTSLVFGEVFRGISLVVQLFWLFFVLPILGISLSATTASILALGLCFGAYGSEVVRTSLLAIPDGQRQAAYALGLSRFKTLALVELPQALVIMLPPMGNLLVLLLKSTSVTALITVQELAFTAGALNSNMGASFALFGYVMAAYYLMGRCVLFGTNWLEQRLLLPGAIAPRQVK